MNGWILLHNTSENRGLIKETIQLSILYHGFQTPKALVSFMLGYRWAAFYQGSVRPLALSTEATEKGAIIVNKEVHIILSLLK